VCTCAARCRRVADVSGGGLVFRLQTERRRAVTYSESDGE